MSHRRTITRDDILPMETFGRIRADKRKELGETKRKRRVAVGPDATFLFENYDTMWMQIHEMLFIEKGGDEQIDDELAAYNPLIPRGDELVATVMFEIDDPNRRAAVLGRLGGVEETMSLEFAGEVIAGRAEEDVDRTNAAGKASSVQFVHFTMTAEQAAQFKQPDTRVIVAINHKGYGHLAVLTEETRAELAGDLD